MAAVGKEEEHAGNVLEGKMDLLNLTRVVTAAIEQGREGGSKPA
jgi:hypothetical protein